MVRWGRKARRASKDLLDHRDPLAPRVRPDRRGQQGLRDRQGQPGHQDLRVRKVRQAPTVRMARPDRQDRRAQMVRLGRRAPRDRKAQPEPPVCLAGISTVTMKKIWKKT
jgi:hypothetical protein